MRISDWSSDVCSSDLIGHEAQQHLRRGLAADAAIDDALAEQRRVGGLPHFGDRIADEHQFLRDALERAVRVEIGRASCRERVCQYVSISVVAVSLKKKNHTIE